MSLDILYQNVSISYEKEKIIQDFSCEISRGEKVVFSGPSGSGKSSLMNALMGFIPISNGEILIDNIPVNSEHIHEIRKKISWLPQEIHFDFKSVKELLNYNFTFINNLQLKPSYGETVSILNDLLLPEEILQKKINEISGGEKQRLLLASVLLLKRPVLLLDEPTSALDENSSKHILHYLSRRDITLISSSHDSYWNEKMDRIIKIHQE